MRTTPPPATSGGREDPRWLAPDQPARTPPAGRRRALIALLLLAPFAVGLAAEAGAAVAVTAGAAAAADRRTTGDYAHAVAAYRALAAHQGPLYWLNRGPITTASGHADAALVAWAEALARGGQTESALGLVDQLHTSSASSPPPGVIGRERVLILMDGARAASASGDQLTAMARINLLSPLPIPQDLRTQADELTTRIEVHGAAALVAAGRSLEAVAALDDVVHRGARSSDGFAAGAMLPETLLAAGRSTLRQCDFKQAAALLDRLAGGFPATAEGQSAAALLGARQDVAGTVVRHDGTVSPGPVRLAEHFVASARGDYALGPYYPGNADTNGDFTISGVPIGGPYVLEVERDGMWLTPIDRDTGQPAYQTSIAALTPVDLTFVVLPS